MTRKRYINLLRATLIEMADQTEVKLIFKNFDRGLERLPAQYAKTYGTFSYAELWKTFEPLAHKYGIGGY